MTCCVCYKLNLLCCVLYIDNLGVLVLFVFALVCVRCVDSYRLAIDVLTFSDGILGAPVCIFVCGAVLWCINIFYYYYFFL